ncbi:MAG: pyruvate formate lyase family protein [Armatimonadota bacterium]
MAVSAKYRGSTGRIRRRYRALKKHERSGFRYIAPDYDYQEPAFESLRNTEGEPWLIRAAKAEAACWTQTAPHWHRDELIVGSRIPDRVLRFFYTTGLSVNDTLAEQFAQTADDPQYGQYVQEAVSYVRDNARLAGPVVAEKCRAEGFESRNPVFWGPAYQGHMVLDYEKLLRMGLGGLREEARRWTNEHGSGHGWEVCAAAVETLKGLQETIRIYARSLRDHGRADQQFIGDRCEWIADHAPRDFSDALQLFWFVYLYDGCDNPGRFDQYMYPFFRKTIDDGTLTGAQTRELLEAMWLKFNENRGWNIAIGGQTFDGEDATNELTYRVLDLCEAFQLPAPNVSVRVFSGSPDRLWERSIEVIGAGTGMPAVYNDDVIVPALQKIGVALEDAREYAFGGCTEIQIPGKSYLGGEDGDLNLAKCFELALHNGVNPVTDEQFGPHTGDPRDFECIEDVWEAYAAQVRHHTELCVRGCNIGLQTRAWAGAKIFRTLLAGDCLRRGLLPDEGGTIYGSGEIMTLGIAVVADSLAAMETMVFDRGEISMTELLEVVDSNFIGLEVVRRRLLNDAPKFGNAEPAADEWAAQVCDHFWKLLKKHETYRGGRYGGGVIVLGRNVTFGEQMGATPDGRRATMPLEGSLGPVAGRAQSGPTASLMSSAAIDQTEAPMGCLRNLTLTGDFFENPGTRQKVADLIRTYFREGGQQIQINVTDRETLQAAQDNPDAHSDLIVRIGGYSDYFVRLSEDLQNDIMQRTAHGP